MLLVKSQIFSRFCLAMLMVSVANAADLACGTNCEECSSLDASLCSKCNSRYSLYQGKCVFRCPKGYMSFQLIFRRRERRTHQNNRILSRESEEITNFPYSCVPCSFLQNCEECQHEGCTKCKTNYYRVTVDRQIMSQSCRSVCYEIFTPDSTTYPDNWYCKGVGFSINSTDRYCLYSEFSECMLCSEERFVTYAGIDASSANPDFQITSCQTSCPAGHTKFTHSNGQIFCKPKCPKNTAFGIYYGCHRCPIECKYGCTEETFECKPKPAPKISVLLRYQVVQIFLDQNNFDVVLSIHVLTEQREPLDFDYFKRLKIREGEFKISSPDFEKAKFKEVKLSKNLRKGTLEAGIIYTEKPNLSEYRLNVQVPNNTEEESEANSTSTSGGESSSSSSSRRGESGPSITVPSEGDRVSSSNRREESGPSIIVPSQRDTGGGSFSLRHRLLLKANSDYSIEHDIKTVKINSIDQPTPKEIDNADKLGHAYGSLSNVSSKSAEALSYFAVLSGLDPSGMLFQFAQGTKLITRHRMISVNHGTLLRTYLKQANEPFDKPTDASESELLRQSNGNKYKFTKFGSTLNLFEFHLIQLILYFICWLAKLYSFWIIHSVSKNLKVTKFQCHFILFQQRFHFISFQIIVLDIWYTGLRTVFHTNSDYNLAVKILSMLCILLTFFDLLEIWYKSSNYYILPQNQEKERESQDNKMSESCMEIKANSQTVKNENQLKKNQSSAINGPPSNLKGKKSKPAMILKENTDFLTNNRKNSENTNTYEIDAIAMLQKFERNITIYKFSTSELKQNVKFSKNVLILVTNYIYLLRILAIHLLLIALPFAPIIQILLLLIVEFTYCSNLVLRYLKVKHLKSLRFLVFKVAQSVFLLAFQIVNLLIWFKAEGSEVPPNAGLQKIGMFIVLSALTCEYLCFILSIAWAVINKLTERKNKSKKRKLEQGYIIYKKIEPLEEIIEPLEGIIEPKEGIVVQDQVQLISNQNKDISKPKIKAKKRLRKKKKSKVASKDRDASNNKKRRRKKKSVTIAMQGVRKFKRRKNTKKPVTQTLSVVMDMNKNINE